jgi:predicted ATPase/class 3 adenylate cyclase
VAPPEEEEGRGFDAGTVIFLFTDIEGSTRLWQEQPSAMQEALARHHALLRTAITAHGGSVFLVVGDGFCAAFGTAQAAVAAAVGAQRALAAEAWGPTGPLRVRMALHAGPASLQRQDVSAGEYASGLTLSHVSRLLSAGHGGQVLLSAAAHGLAAGALPDGAALRDLGVHRLRDLPLPEHIYQLTAPGLPDAFPSLRTAGASAGNLPAPLTSFIGRERELSELAEVLSGARLLTLTGSGGTGKTRLALQLARESAEQYPDGAWLVELAPVADPGLLVQTVAAALGLREQPGRPLLATLKDALATSEALLLLDNCEHLLDASAALVADLLQSAPGLKVLATSREPLAVSGEVVYRVASLSLPDPLQTPPAADLMRYEAARLLVERAQAAQPGFRLTDANAAAIARICQRLDGIPLALELAATRLRTLSAEQIAARLDDYFSLLTGGVRTALPRQQTLRALIDWSYDLLSEPERALLRRLSVFSGGWTLEAAEAVGRKDRNLEPGFGGPHGAAGQERELDVLETLGRLVDRSLVIAETPDVGRNGISPYEPTETRYRLLEMIRQYAREKLLAAGESAAIRDRHLAFYAGLAEAGEPALHRPDQAGWLARLDTELDNLRSAMGWAMGTHPLAALQIAADLREFWTRRGLATEGRRWLGEALERVEETPESATGEVERTRARGRGLTGLATLLIAQGEFGRAFPAAQEGVRLARGTGDAHDLILPLAMFAFIAGMSGHPDEARNAAQEVLTLPREPADEVWVGLTWSTLAYLASGLERDYGKARAYLLEGRAISRNVGDAWAEGMVAFNLGTLAFAQGDYGEAQARFHESLATWEGTGEHYFTHLPTSGLADVARRTGKNDRAEALYRQLVTRWQQVGNVGAMARCIECLAFVSVARGDAGPNREMQWQHAARLLGAAEAQREASASLMMPEERAEYDQVKGRLLGTDGRPPLPGVLDAWRQGRAMTRAQAVEYALCSDGSTSIAGAI